MTCLLVDTDSIIDKRELITNSINLLNKKCGSPSGGYFSDSEILNYGNILFESSAFYIGVGGVN